MISDKRSTKNIVILGAGNSGLSVGWGLSQRAGYDVVILEASSAVGGLSRTMERDGIKFDIGPHRLSPQIPSIVDKIRQLLGDDLMEKTNMHGVYFNGVVYSYPPDLAELLNFSTLKHTVRFVMSWIATKLYFWGKSFFYRHRESFFEDALMNAFGKSFYREVIFPMITKVWGTSDLHYEFANLRFESPKFTRVFRRIFLKENTASDAIFYYPKRGFGHICEAIAQHIMKNGQDVRLGINIDRIEAKSLNGPFKIVYSRNGDTEIIDADVLVSTISNKSLIHYFSKTGCVEPLLNDIDNFASRTMRLAVLAVKNFHLSTRLIIFPESRFIFNRIAEMNMFSESICPEDHAVLMVDVVYDKDSDYALMGDEEFNRKLRHSILSLNWFKEADISKFFSICIPNAYPVLNNRRYFAQERIEQFFYGSNVILCGREASTDYNNAHNAIGKGFLAASYISGEISADEYKQKSRIIGRLPIQD